MFTSDLFFQNYFPLSLHFVAYKNNNKKITKLLYIVFFVFVWKKTGKTS